MNKGLQIVENTTEFASDVIMPYFKGLTTREEVARSIRFDFGFDAHIGGHHVAGLNMAGDRVLMVTGDFPDFQ